MATSAITVLPGSETLQPHVENSIPYYTFHRLGEFLELEHLVFTRLGGVSSPPFASLNVSYDTGDEAGKVQENMRRVRAATDCSSLIYARQSHSSNIVVLREHPHLDPTIPYPLHGKDGFITQLSGLLMMIKVADCQAILLYDPEKKVVAIIHAGWRGSVKNIAGNAVHLMRAHFGCDPQDIFAGIGPSLGPCCGEFRNWRQELPPSFSRFQVQENYYDFWAISQYQLMGVGLLREHIEVSGLCTKCHPEVFYSYRGEGETGRFAVVIGIKDSLHF
ncbi:MAG: peptidoglycan editing factor PgeF [Deltaproteobacteria bacterium]|nr:MAG: peptidoglycan editing factor PgeF [Deltaproteobacteria bacterium]